MTSEPLTNEEQAILRTSLLRYRDHLVLWCEKFDPEGQPHPYNAYHRAIGHVNALMKKVLPGD